MDAAAAGTYFDSQGWELSSDLLARYLDNKPAGFIYEISTRHYIRVMATAGAKAAFAQGVEEIKNQARQNPQIGITQELSSVWLGVQPGDDDDIDHALGHYDVAVGSDTTVSEVDGGLQAEIIYKTYVYEYYNYDKDSETGPLSVVNNEMRHLEEAGWARSFRVHGEAELLFRRVEKL
ncbi:hypothetical protein ACFO5K_22865 [Nocardia halotolerans]|uniref:Uncharacterized protein n=1 Tax=Nocardia halotolerans TaxID=1755878 RepID=A0ABV8VLJ6_9NOCA